MREVNLFSSASLFPLTNQSEMHSTWMKCRFFCIVPKMQLCILISLWRKVPWLISDRFSPTNKSNKWIVQFWLVLKSKSMSNICFLWTQFVTTTYTFRLHHLSLFQTIFLCHLTKTTKALICLFISVSASEFLQVVGKYMLVYC